MIDFQNTQIAFAHLSDKELVRKKRVFTIISKPSFNRLGKSLVMLAKKLKIPYAWGAHFIYNQFVGGETIDRCAPVIDRLYESKVFSIPDYSAEGKEDIRFFEKVTNEVLLSIQKASTSKGKIPFAVFKPTGIARFDLLEKVSSKIALREREIAEWEETKERFVRIAEAASKFNVPVMIDAEETWIQPAVDDVFLSLARIYNRDKTIIFNTLQMYRIDRLDYFKLMLMKAQKENFKLGIKLVRGAYHEKECLRSESLKYVNPVFIQKQDTDDAYNNALKLSIENIAKVSLVCATHNQKSTQFLLDLMLQHSISAKDSRIWFAQLYGMSDTITFNLGASGYNAAKYLPYGEVETVIPYLIRRAEENSASKGETGRELQIIKTEILRRKGMQNNS